MQCTGQKASEELNKHDGVAILSIVILNLLKFSKLKDGCNIN